MKRAVPRLTAALVVLVASAAPALARPASAANEVHAFALPAEPLAEALVDFAVQADLSIATPAGGLGDARGRPVSGRLPVETALSLLLDGSGYGFDLLPDRSVRIRRLPRPAAPATPPAPPVADVTTPVAEVVVTATKRPQALDRLAGSAAVASQRTLQQAGVADTTGLQALTAGVLVTNLGPGRDKIIIRGLSDGSWTGKTQSTVGLYLDEAQITYDAPDPDLRLADVQAVEVLRGPQGTLYGAGSMSGVLHVVTNKPDLEQASGYVLAGASATRNGSSGSEFEAMANLPLVEDRLGVRAVAYREEDGGWVDDPALGLSDVNRTRRWGGRVALTFQASPDWSVSAGAAYQAIDSADSQYVEDRAGLTSRDVRMREPHDNDFLDVWTTIQGRTPWGVLTSTTSVVRHHLDTRYDATDALPLLAPGAPGPAAWDASDRIEMLVQEMRLAAPAGARTHWVIGASASQGEETLDSGLTASDATALFREHRVDRVNNYALFGQALFPVGPQLRIGGGLRLSYSTLTTTADESGSVVSTAVDRDRLHASDAAPELLATWEPRPWVMAYLQVSEGFRLGGFNTSALAPVGGAAQPFARYAGDRLRNYEVGVKASALDERLQVRAAVFYDRWKQIQTDQLSPAGIAFTGNAGDGTNLGLEIEAGFAPTRRWELGAHLLLDDPELARADPSFPAHGDASLPSVPSTSGGVSVTYTRPLPGGLTGFARADAAYVGRSHLTFDDTTARAMGGYLSGGLRAGVETRDWRLSAYLTNPLDTRDVTFAYGNPFSLRATGQTVRQRPETVGVVIQRNF